jgi:hypothetical protein
VRTIRHIVCATAAAALVSPGVAGAAPGDPSIDQYIEAIPTSAGPQAAVGVEERVQPLTIEAGRRVKAEGGSDVDALTKIATSSRYGAPVDSKPVKTGNGAETSALMRIPASQAAASAESRLVALVAFMTVSLAAALAYAWRRSKTDRDRP